MYVANTHLKPVIGIDIHFVNTPIPFIPLPHPYIGLVIDPFDYIPFIGATVKVNHVPRGNTDTMGMIITFVHIPFGIGFSMMPIIGHDSQNFFGSKTVSVDGAPMSGAGYMLMTCNDIGLPLSVRPGKKFIPIPSLYLPTSYCIPLQWGKPVLVGGPLVPNFNLMTLLKAFVFGSFLKILGKLGGRLLKSLNKKILRKFPSSQKLSKRLCKMGFEPVDLITGRVNYEYTDFELPGPIPVKWTRNWDSDSSIAGPLGHGVHACYDRTIQLWPEEQCLSLTMADGRLVVFPLLYHGESFYHPQEKLELRRKQNGHFVLDDYNEALYYHFNYETKPGAWQLSYIENYSGNRIQLHYTGKYLNAITDSVGRVLLFTLDNEHRITQVTVKHRGEEQLLVMYVYNEQGDLMAVADALGQVITMEYRYHLMTKKTDRNGQSFYWEYDSKKRCIHTWGDGGILEGFIQYKKGYNIVTNSLGENTVYYFDDNNLCIQVTDHYGQHTYTEYNDNFDLYREIDEQGNITGYVYDDKGLLKEKTFPGGNSMQFRFNEYNQPVLIINPDGSSQTFGYDALRRLCFINYPNGKSVTYDYNDKGQLESVMETGNRKTTMTFDEDENMASLQLPTGATAYWKYDALGRCIQATNAEGQVRFIEYDVLNRVHQFHLPDGNTIQLQYNAYDEVIKVTDRNDEVAFEYTPLGSIKKRIQNNNTIQFLYDTEERLRAIVNEKNRHYRLDYNKRGEVINEIRFDGTQKQYLRDAAGKIIKTIHAGGAETAYEYDANGNVVRIDYHDGSWELFSYDLCGNLQETSNEYSTVKFTRNKAGFIETEEQNGYTVNSLYDKLGRRIRITSSLGADIRLQRSKTGLVTHLQATAQLSNKQEMPPAFWETHIQYNQLAQETARLLPGGLRSEWTYDHTGKPTGHKVSRHGALQNWKKYTWETNDQLTNIFDALSKNNTSFKYDTGNLVFAQYAGNQVMHRATDDTGNIYETVTKGDRVYNAAGALLECKKYSYKYDVEGRLISKTSKSTQKKTRYTWYASGLLKKVLQPDGKSIEFIYDTLGRRIEKRTAGTVTRWVWDGNVPLHEWQYDSSNRPQAVVNEWGEITYDKEEPHPLNLPANAAGITWIFDADSFVPCAKIENGHTYSIITDHLGTPVQAYDAAGKKVWELVLDVYGRATAITGEKDFIPFRYKGQYEDAGTGLYYNRFRYYDAQSGNYVSPDPIGIAAGPNAYAYVHDPNSWVDVNGLSGVPDFATLKDMAQHTLDFSTGKDQAVFWSGNNTRTNMEVAQNWAKANGKMTLEQTRGGQILNDMNLFGPGSGLTGQQAAEVWDIASKRFAEGASGNIHVFSTDAKKINKWGNLRTWWRIELPALLKNPHVTSITRMKRDGTPAKTGHIKCK
jgi:RHS repeat-associated protein